MPYCTQQNLITRFTEQEIIQLTDRANTGVVDAAVVAEAIYDAEAEIDSYLTAYALPLAVIPPNFERLACDIARYYLYDDAATEQVIRRYDSAVAYLKEILNGKVNLSSGSSTEASAGIAADIGAGLDFKTGSASFGDLSGF